MQSAVIIFLGAGGGIAIFPRGASRARHRISIPSFIVKIAAILLVALIAALLVPAASEYSQALTIASLVVALALLAMLFATTGRIPAPAPAVAEAVKPAAPTVSRNQAEAEIITLLGIFQEKGRLVDFLMEDITPYNDADVGGVARAVHQGCKQALKEHFQIEPVSNEGEGATITVPAGDAAEDFRLVGNLAGQAPFSGKIVHKGWKTASVTLPRVLKSDRLPVIAPAQVEVV